MGQQTVDSLRSSALAEQLAEADPHDIIVTTRATALEALYRHIDERMKAVKDLARRLAYEDIDQVELESGLWSVGAAQEELDRLVVDGGWVDQGGGE